MSKLGSVVGPRGPCGHVFFRRARGCRLFAVQERIAAREVRVVTVLTEPSRASAGGVVSARRNTMRSCRVAVDEHVPRPAPTRSRDVPGRRCLFAGNIYDPVSQAGAHATLIAKLNGLGRPARGARRPPLLHGTGRARRASTPPRSRIIGAVPTRRRGAICSTPDVGLVLALGPQPNENESTKIYHYLRVGLPTVCEAGFPNQGLVVTRPRPSVSPTETCRLSPTRSRRRSVATWDRAGAIDFVLARAYLAASARCLRRARPRCGDATP